MKTPNNADQIISKLKLLCANSCPPLKPIENNKYKEINLEELGGISKSLLNLVAMIPNRKNSNAGLVKLSISNSRFICYFFVARSRRSLIDLPSSKSGNFSATIMSNFILSSRCKAAYKLDIASFKSPRSDKTSW